MSATTAVAWAVFALLIVCAGAVVVDLVRNRALDEMQAQLDELAGDYPSPAARMKALEDALYQDDAPTEVLVLDSVTPAQVVCPTVPNWNPRPEVPGTTPAGKHRAPEETPS